MRKQSALTKTTIAPDIAARMGELQRSARRAAPLLKAMSNPSRLVILCQLAEGERSVGELAQAVGLSQSGISQHLAVLRREHVVATRRDKQTVFYCLASAEVVHRGRTTGLVECRVMDERSRLVAHSTCTCLVLRGAQAAGRGLGDSAPG